MAVLDRGKAPPEKRRDRLSLSTWRPRKCSTGGEQTQHSPKLEEAQRWGAAICSARNAWSIQQRANGLADRRLFKNDAERVLQRALASLGNGGVHG